MKQPLIDSVWALARPITILHSVDNWVRWEVKVTIHNAIMFPIRGSLRNSVKEVLNKYDKSGTL